MSSLSINEKIAEAMDKLIERRLAGEAYDKTLIGTIIAIIESATGHYRVEIDSILYEAHSLDSSRAYEVGDQVYIKIPQGNMDMRKFIEGQVINEPKYEKINKYVEGSPKFEFVLTSKDKILGLIAQEQENEKIIWNNISENSIRLEDAELRANFSNIFNLILNEQNEYDIVKFSVKLSTKFLAPQPDLGSNYGLKFYFKNTSLPEAEDLDKIIVLDILNFNILPWQYSKGYYTQYVRIDKADIEGYELTQISMFQKCLFNDLQSNNENILFKDIAITFEKQVITEEEANTNNYSIQLSSLEKWYNSSILKDVYYGEVVNISANLFDSNNKNISEEQAYTFHWYKQAIPTESKFKFRDKIAGWGWVSIPQISETLEIQDSTGKKKKKKSLYDGEVKTIKRKYRKGTYEQEKALYELNKKYGVTVNNVQITPTVPYRNYKVIVTKLNNKKEEEIIAEKEFMVAQDKENLELYLNAQLNINLMEEDILTFQAEIKGDSSIYLVPYWKIEVYDNKGKKIKTIEEYNDLINVYIAKTQNIKYTSYIYQQDELDNKNKTFIKYINGEWPPKEEEVNIATFNLSPRASRDFTPNEYISDETYIFKSETQEYLTLKDYILSYVKV